MKQAYLDLKREWDDLAAELGGAAGGEGH